MHDQNRHLQLTCLTHVLPYSRHNPRHPSRKNKLPCRLAQRREPFAQNHTLQLKPRRNRQSHSTSQRKPQQKDRAVSSTNKLAIRRNGVFLTMSRTRPPCTPSISRVVEHQRRNPHRLQQTLHPTPILHPLPDPMTDQKHRSLLCLNPLNLFCLNIDSRQIPSTARDPHPPRIARKLTQDPPHTPVPSIAEKQRTANHRQPRRKNPLPHLCASTVTRSRTLFFQAFSTSNSSRATPHTRTFAAGSSTARNRFTAFDPMQSLREESTLISSTPPPTRPSSSPRAKPAATTTARSSSPSYAPACPTSPPSA
jgi:hypothetical protein